MARAGRGRFKIFLGMAAGVGKTYRMLQEGRAEAEAGRDVVIGYLEPHGRAETTAQAEGLERLPRRRVTYRGSVLEEMDLPAIFRRAPDLCLIDELAHSNAPGAEHPKRYEDIADVLDAGIDVFSTVNVQHLETLNDQVAELTRDPGARDVSGLGACRRRRGGAHRPHPRGPDRAPARGEDLPGRADRGLPQQLLPDREPRHPARTGAAPGGAGSRGQAARGAAGRPGRHP